MQQKIIDIETRSAADLKKVGAWRYSKDVTTRINCIAVNRAGVIEMYDHEACKDPKSERMQKLYTELSREDSELIFHNACFELYHFLNVYGWKFNLKNVTCTMAKAAYYHLPQSLDAAAQALKLSVLKDTGKGYKAMLLLCQPIKDKTGGKARFYTPEDKPQEFIDMYHYCGIDTEATRHLNNALPNLPPSEREIWRMDFEINQRGVPLDWFLVTNACELIDSELAKIDAEVVELTDGELDSARQVKALAAWLSKQLGRNLNSVKEEVIDELIADDSIQGTVRRVLELRQVSGLASLSKFKAMREAITQGSNNVVDNFWYYGAHTGRWTGKGIQLHNLVKGYDDDLCEALAHSDTGFIKAFYA